MAALDQRDYVAAKDILEPLIAAEPTVYFRYPRLGAAYAGIAGFELLNLASVGSSGGGATPFELLNDFIPAPNPAAPEQYQARIDAMKAARDLLERMPEAERSNGHSFYGSSAKLQYTLYQSFYSIMLMNRFVAPTVDGDIDRSILTTMTPDDAVAIIENLTATSQMEGNEALSPTIEEALLEIEAQGQGSLRENLIRYIEIKNAKDDAP
jgi:hypothetical protein